MPAHGQFITLREGSESTALVAPELGAWLLRYTRHFPRHGDVDAIHFSQEVVDRYPNQMYAGNPLLFPQVSFSRAGGQEHYYDWQGTRYPLPQHGFARRSPWKTAQVTPSSILMELADSPETLRAYPFRFHCQVRYELKNGRLYYHQTIENRGPTPLPFSTGIHPYFNVPLSSAGLRDHCYVELPAAKRAVPQGNWESWTVEPRPAGKLSVADDVSGTLFLAELEAPQVRLVDPRSRLSVTLDWSEAPDHRFVAIWSKSTQEPFYCIEPWTALPNSLGRQPTELTHLPPGAKSHASMWIEIREDV